MKIKSEAFKQSKSCPWIYYPCRKVVAQLVVVVSARIIF